MPWEKVITANSTFVVSATLLKPQKVVSSGKVQHVSSDTCHDISHSAYAGDEEAGGK